jgi:gustatory receptor
MTYFWIFVCFFGSLYWTIGPMMTGDFSKLPLDVWYPSGLDGSFQYVAAYIGQIFGQIQVGLTFGSTSIMFSSLVFYVCGQFDILCCSLKNIRNTAIIKCGGYNGLLQAEQEDYFKNPEWPKFYYVGMEKRENLDAVLRSKSVPAKSTVEMDANIEAHLNEALIDCIDHHILLVDFCKKMEKTFNVYTLMSAATATILICILAYLASTGNISSFNLTSVLAYFYLANAQWLLLCYWGHVLKNQVTLSGRS